jgi:hypothetical protein
MTSQRMRALRGSMDSGLRESILDYLYGRQRRARPAIPFRQAAPLREG